MNRFFCLLVAALIWAFPVHAGTLAQFRTPLGDIEVELFEDKPVTTRNFIRYVQGGLYQNMFFHRWSPSFVIQGGGFFVTNRFAQPEIAGVQNLGTIPNEFDVGQRRSNIYGTIAMAKVGGDPDSASSQWFFNLGDNSANLDAQNGGFTVFGRVVRGTNVLNRFLDPPQLNNLKIASLNPPLNELPVLSTNLTWGDLIYVDITLLNVRVQTLEAGGREISWNSVQDRPNHIEFTPTMPPEWHTLVITNGTGGPMKFIDASTKAGIRFYRVRIDY
jgi:cyclophilin family peptidyl-prolyl cis-trans isomerase